VREGPLARVASRGTQRRADPATDQRAVKRDGSGGGSPTIRACAYHGEAEAHEGQVDCRLLIVAR